MDELIARVQRLIVESLQLEGIDPPSIDPDAPLFGDGGLGLDSVDALELAMEVERQFGHRLEDDASTREIMGSVRSLAAWIDGRQRG